MVRVPEGKSRRARWAAALTAVAAVVLTAMGGSAWGTDPVPLGSGYVTDLAQALSAGEADDAQARLESLSAATEAQLYVVFVDDFTNPDDREQWANAVAEQNGLGPAQYLLAVATEGRQYYS